MGSDCLTVREVTLEEMLAAREYRALRQKELLQRFSSSLVCFTLNIPGPVKTSEKYEKIFDQGIAGIRKQLKLYIDKPLFEQEVREKTGYEYYAVINADSIYVKQLLVVLEEQKRVGRLYDIDVLNSEGVKVSRTEVGMPPRKCLICGETAQICSRSRKHSVEELQAAIEQLEEN